MNRRSFLKSTGSSFLIGYFGSNYPESNSNSRNRYPRDDFMFGTSTAAHQVEGGLKNNWSRWSKEKDNLEGAGKAVNHYNRFEEDYDMARELNNNAHRLSIAWSRVMPDKNTINKDALQHYKNRVEYLRRHNIEPIVSLWHFSHPQWFMDEGGWVSGPINKFYDFVRETVKFLSDDVRIWITLNEPQGFAAVSYLAGIWPNYKNGISPYLRAEKNMSDAVKKSKDIIDEYIKEPYVGSALAYINITSDNTILGNTAKLMGDKLANYRFIDKIEDSLDFIGMNYYFNREVGLNGINQPEGTKQKTPPFPNRLKDVLIDCWNRYNIPIIITETGTATGHKREWYINESVKSMLKAVNSGVSIHGYLYWTLLDCYEWHSGWGMDFGLIDVNREDQSRKIREAGYLLSKISNRYAGEIVDGKNIDILDYENRMK